MRDACPLAALPDLEAPLVLCRVLTRYQMS